MEGLVLDTDEKGYMLSCIHLHLLLLINVDIIQR